MKKITCLFLLFLLGIPSVQSGIIRFNQIWYGGISTEDQEHLQDLIVYGDSVFMLTDYFIAHSFSSGVNFWKIDLTQPTASEYNQYAKREGIWELIYSRDMYSIDTSLWIQNRLVLMDDIIHIPDLEDYSHQFTLEGKYLGRFPNFSEKERRLPAIVTIKGATIQFPLTLLGNTYQKMIPLDTAVLFLSKNLVTAFAIDELNRLGTDAPAYSIPKEGIVNRVYNHYFFMNRELYEVTPKPRIERIAVAQTPNPPCREWSFTQGDRYFQIEPTGWGYMTILVVYRYSGFDATSSIFLPKWQEFR